ncbi:MAG TPA: arsenic resistance N-acetyltransferase ArsN2 [Bacteroidales bacterium]|nr:arsenic resistance N-acetyltransferase ArsN2 [Bacteroidales bacterium]
MIKYDQAEKADFKEIFKLLEINGLPYSDLNDNPVTFFVARDGEKIIGSIGLEMYGYDGLLRSFAVIPEMQNHGIGKELYGNLMAFVKQNRIKTVHLLTDTARDYFSRIGFRLSNRKDAPERIVQSTEFSGLCPNSSTYMVLDIIP